MSKTRDEVMIESIRNTPSNINIGRLPQHPTLEDLKMFSKIRLKKKRSIKKFRKGWSRYVPDYIYAEYMAKVLVAPIYRSLNYQSIGRKLFSVEPMPPHQGVVK